MNLRIYDPKILAIDLRHRRLGYAVFEGHRVLLDSGLRVYRAVGEVEVEMASKRLAVLLKTFAPSAIVIKRERWDMAQKSPHIRNLVEVVQKITSAHSIPIFLIQHEEVRTTFRNLGCETRDEIAYVLARIFPELVWKLPPKRRAWQSEHPRMAIFDAIALGLTYWQHGDMPSPSPPN
jgi:hypothetical protein